MPVGHFQIRLGRRGWTDYKKEEDEILKRAFLAGFPHAKFSLRGSDYQYEFKEMRQTNLESGRHRDIRPPYGWKAPSKPVVEKGPTTSIQVPPGSPGTTIMIAHPKDNAWMISVSVPKTAKPGQTMLVPVPDLGSPGLVAAAAVKEKVEAGGGSWGTGKKVAVGTAGAVALGGVVVAGGVLGMYAAEHGVDATADMLADGAADAGDLLADLGGDAGDLLGDGAGDAGDFIGELADGAAPLVEEGGDFICDAADSAGDFIMDLF